MDDIHSLLSTFALVLPLFFFLIGLLSAWVFFRGKPATDEALHLKNWRTAVFAIALGTFVAVYQLKFDVEQAKSVASVVGSTRAVRVLSDYVTTSDAIYSKSSFLGYLYSRQFEKFAKTVDDARQNRVFVEKEDLPDIAIKMIDLAKHSIRATSYIRDTDWWRGPWRRLYLDENKRASERGVQIERIFIFPDEKTYTEDRGLLVENANAGVDVRYVLVEDLGDLGRPYTRDVIDVDDSVGSILNLDGRFFQSAEFTSDLEGIARTLSVIEEAAHRFQCPAVDCPSLGKINHA